MMCCKRSTKERREPVAASGLACWLTNDAAVPDRKANGGQARPLVATGAPVAASGLACWLICVHHGRGVQSGQAGRPEERMKDFKKG